MHIDFSYPFIRPALSNTDLIKLLNTIQSILTDFSGEGKPNSFHFFVRFAVNSVHLDSEAALCQSLATSFLHNYVRTTFHSLFPPKFNIQIALNRHNHPSHIHIMRCIVLYIVFIPILSFQFGFLLTANKVLCHHIDEMKRNVFYIL